MGTIDRIFHRPGVVEKAQETHFELTAQSARFVMSLAPEIPETGRNALNARGAERLRNVLSLATARLVTGRSTWRETLVEREPMSRVSRTRPEAAE